jgi:hypothetical protein
LESDLLPVPWTATQASASLLEFNGLRLSKIVSQEYRKADTKVITLMDFPSGRPQPQSGILYDLEIR